APVGVVLHRSATAPFPPASFAAMIPEPTPAMINSDAPRDRKTANQVGASKSAKPLLTAAHDHWPDLARPRMFSSAGTLFRPRVIFRRRDRWDRNELAAGSS